MHLRRCIVAVIFAVSHSLAIGQTRAQPESYLCVIDQETGFTHDKASGEWKQMNFKEQPKFVVSRSKDSEGIWVTKLGMPGNWALCRKDFLEDGSLLCLGASEFED